MRLFPKNEETMMIPRRQLIRKTLLTIPTLSLSSILTPHTFGSERPYDDDCGVASGDPSSDGFVIWTRLPQKARQSGEKKYEVFYDISLTSSFRSQDIVVSGSLIASEDMDFTVKTRIQNLLPQTHYYYRFFTDAPYTSVIGRSKTAPLSTDSTAKIKVALITCQQMSDGLYSVFDNIAHEDLDVVLHLGDHIYEKESGRIWKKDPLGGRQASTLNDYRAKYRYYLSDPAYRHARSLFPFVDIWDDHEVLNDYAGSTARAENKELFKAGYQAFLEYMPFETELSIDASGTPTMPIYRTITLGSRLQIFATDSRQYRSPHPGYWQGRRHETERTILGQGQKNWLKSMLAESSCQWKLIMSEVMMAPLRLGLKTAQDEDMALRLFGNFSQQDRGFYVNLDQWDGFPAERSEILNFIKNEKIKNVMVAAGDIHASFDSLLYADSEQTQGTPTALEVVTPSITSTTIGRFVGGVLSPLLEMAIRKSNPQMVDSNIMKNGYTVLTFSEEGTEVRHMFIDHIWESGAVARSQGTKWVPHHKAIFI
jgi:alkaline phosphatase D